MVALLAFLQLHGDLSIPRLDRGIDSERHRQPSEKEETWSERAEGGRRDRKRKGLRS